MHLSGPGLAAKLRWQREPPGGRGCDEVTGLAGGALETPARSTATGCQ
jgi:hypothetical protein